MRNIFFAIATVVLFFTVSPAFCASSPTLKEVGMFADEYVGKTFTFDVYISTYSIIYLSDRADDDGNFGITLCDEHQKSLTGNYIGTVLGSSRLYTSLNRSQTKELMKNLDSSKFYFYRKQIRFTVTKENYNGQSYFAGRITSIK